MHRGKSSNTKAALCSKWLICNLSFSRISMFVRCSPYGHHRITLQAITGNMVSRHVSKIPCHLLSTAGGLQNPGACGGATCAAAHRRGRSLNRAWNAAGGEPRQCTPAASGRTLCGQLAGDAARDGSAGVLWNRPQPNRHRCSCQSEPPSKRCIVAWRVHLSCMYRGSLELLGLILQVAQSGTSSVIAAARARRQQQCRCRS